MLFLVAGESCLAKDGKQEVAAGDVTQAATPELRRLIVSKPKQKGEHDA
jgi:hypothetical protein